MRVYKIRVHEKTPTDRNPSVVAAIFFGDTVDAGTWRRVFKHRGIHPLFSLERDMVQKEIEYYEACWRLYYCVYQDWEGFIVDEYDITQDLAWCQQIHELAKLRKPLEEIIKP